MVDPLSSGVFRSEVTALRFVAVYNCLDFSSFCSSAAPICWPEHFSSRIWIFISWEWILSSKSAIFLSYFSWRIPFFSQWVYQCRIQKCPVYSLQHKNPRKVLTTMRKRCIVATSYCLAGSKSIMYLVWYRPRFNISLTRSVWSFLLSLYARKTVHSVKDIL